jgi:hypothetical protein
MGVAWLGGKAGWGKAGDGIAMELEHLLHAKWGTFFFDLACFWDGGTRWRHEVEGKRCREGGRHCFHVYLSRSWVTRSTVN